jgi:hypothetical protein
MSSINFGMRSQFLTTVFIVYIALNLASILSYVACLTISEPSICVIINVSVLL